MKILSTQLLINISMKEMNMTVSEHSVGFYSLLFPPWGTWLGQVPTTAAAAKDHAALHAPCCSGGDGRADPQGMSDSSSSGVYTVVKSPKHNTDCIEWWNNINGDHERAKHIHIRKHFTQEAIKNGHMILRKIATTSQLVDIIPQREMCIQGLLGQPLEPSNKSVVAQEGED